MLRRVIGGIAGAIVVVASGSSCVANDASIVILGILAPPTSSSTGSSATCVYQATITGPFINFGSIDVAFAEQYAPALLLGNQLVAQGNASLDRIETDNINVDGAVVTVTDAGGATLDSYTVNSAAFLQPSSGGTPGLAVYIVPIVSPAAADKARSDLQANGGTKRLISNVYVFGTTSGGTHIESGTIQFAVDACIGCLVTFPSGSDDPTMAQPNCNASSSASGSTITQPCVLGQDQYIDCRLCSATYAVCQP
jgi:hypothetical protein